jgi:hypothetical protein
MRPMRGLLVTIATALLAACTVQDPPARYAPSTSPAQPFEDTSTEARRCPPGTHEEGAERGLPPDAWTRHCVPDELPDKEPIP